MKKRDLNNLDFLDLSTMITDNDWHLNFKSSANLTETRSAIADGS